MTALPQRQPIASERAAAPAETLPGWTYGNAEFYELEKRNLVLANWQVVGHVSELRSFYDIHVSRCVYHSEVRLVRNGLELEAEHVRIGDDVLHCLQLG